MVDRERCTGCGACAVVCGRAAIRMQPDEDGFQYPQIDRMLCVDCGKCNAVCPVPAVPEKSNHPENAWMAYTKDEALRRASSSGGVFSMLANQILSRGGVVFGCAMSDDCYSACHTGVDSAEGLEKLRGSKYVQSDLGDTIRQARTELDAGRWVLFSGTPCQVAGLKAVLGNKNYEKLLTVDLICHGVPSPAVWERYVRETEAEYGAKVTGVSFRDKSRGWKNFSLALELSNGMTRSQTVAEDPYLRGFIGNLYLRRSCHQCVFKGTGYRSDLTLADFWGVERFCPEENNDRGVSVVIAHTRSGMQWMDALGQDAVMKTVEMENMETANPSYYRSAPANPLRERVLKEIKNNTTRKVVEKYWGKSLISKIRRKLFSLLG